MGFTKNIVFPFVIIAENVHDFCFPFNLQIEVNFMMYWIHIETIISKNLIMIVYPLL